MMVFDVRADLTIKPVAAQYSFEPSVKRAFPALPDCDGSSGGFVGVIPQTAIVPVPPVLVTFTVIAPVPVVNAVMAPTIQLPVLAVLTI